MACDLLVVVMCALGVGKQVQGVNHLTEKQYETRTTHRPGNDIYRAGNQGYVGTPSIVLDKQTVKGWLL
jgi:hypothetical protein